MIINEFLEIFQYGFIIKALLAGFFIGIPCAILGVFLLLKNMSLIGDGLAHVSFATVAIALLFSTEPLIISIPLVILASLLILKLEEKAKIGGDAAIGMVSATAIAVGVIITSLNKGFNVDLFSFLFGSILMINISELIISVIASISVVIVIMIYYKELFSATFDEEYAKATGIDVNKLNIILSILTSVTIVVGIRIVGTLLISSLIIFPAVTALNFKKGFKLTIMIAVAISIIAIILGIIISFFTNLPTGATIVVVNGVLYLISLLLNKIRG